MECTTYQAHLNATLDHLIGAIPSCSNISQQLHRRDLKRIILEDKQSALVARLDPGHQGVTTLPRGSDCHNDFSQACNRVLCTGIFKCLSKSVAFVWVWRASEILKIIIVVFRSLNRGHLFKDVLDSDIDNVREAHDPIVFSIK